MRRRSEFPGVTAITDRHGRRRYRFRMKDRPGCYLKGEWGSKEFRKEYERAVSATSKPEPGEKAVYGSFDWLIQQEYSSPAWQKKARITRQNQTSETERFRVKFGRALVADVQPRHVEDIIAALSDRPAAANSMLKMIRRLCRFAIRKGLIKHDPTVGVEKYATNPDGYHTWTDAEIALFEAHHGIGSKPVLALRLMLCTGAARQDVIALGWQNIRGGRIAYRRKKTGGDVDLKLSLMPDLASLIEALPKDRMLFLNWGEEGQSYTPAGFGNRFREWCAKAGLPHCSAHGLRKAGATRLANAGATELELQAFLGHRTPDEARTYVKKFNRAKLGDSGLEKLLGAANLVERLDNHRSK